jgi:hypothetical protein
MRDVYYLSANNNQFFEVPQIGQIRSLIQGTPIGRKAIIPKLEDGIMVFVRAKKLVLWLQYYA